MKINRAQSVVLILGGLLLLIIAVNSQLNEPIMSRDGVVSWNQVFDWKGALVRAVIIAGAFGGFFFAFGKNKE